VHTIGFELEEAEFEARHDFKVSVAGIYVSGQRGETVKMPYWVGRILDENDIGMVKMPDMVTALKQALSKERTVGPKQFPALEPLFYIKLREYMKRLDERDYNRVYDMLLELFRRRSNKLVARASSMKMSAEINDKLTVEERAFYNLVYRTCSGFETHITAREAGK